MSDVSDDRVPRKAKSAVPPPPDKGAPTNGSDPDSTSSKLEKPERGFLDKFKSTKPPTIAGVETLLTPLSIMRIAEADDWVRLHEDEDNYWTCELCFVSVPVDGDKPAMLHLIDEDIAVQYLHAKKIKRQRLALATKPRNKFFLCIVPSQNLDNPYNATALAACEKAKTLWVQALSRKTEGVDEYKVESVNNPDFTRDLKWLTRSLEELVTVTFKGAMIETDDHPGLLRLLGKPQNLK